MRSIGIIALAGLCALGSPAPGAQLEESDGPGGVAVSAGGTVPTVGMEASVRVTVAGSVLEAVLDQGEASPLRVWIASTVPEGDAFRYDLRFVALEPGRKDLAPLLRRADGADDPIPPIPAYVAPLLPEGLLTSVGFTPDEVALPGEGGARRILLGAALLLLLLPLGFLLLRRLLREPARAGGLGPADVRAEIDRLAKLADRGRLTREGLARLERLVVSESRGRRGVSREALRAIRDELHRPGPAGPSRLAELVHDRERAARPEESR